MEPLPLLLISEKTVSAAWVLVPPALKSASNCDLVTWPLLLGFIAAHKLLSADEEPCDDPLLLLCPCAASKAAKELPDSGPLVLLLPVEADDEVDVDVAAPAPVPPETSPKRSAAL